MDDDVADVDKYTTMMTNHNRMDYDDDEDNGDDGDLVFYFINPPPYNKNLPT